MKKLVAALAALLGASGCGYRVVGAEAESAEPLAVVPAPGVVTSAVAEEGVVAGARAELAATGLLASCDPRTDARCPALVIELMRIEEGGAAPGLATRDGPPLARSVTLTLRGRAFIRRTKDAPPERPGPDLTVREFAAREDDPTRFHATREEALRRAGKRLGALLVRRALE
ncbi:hypothetical protein [Polyangium sp. y55x31]|uniref:hypothetical protein n=1 Tax=Polyangium sp. y55x31 TaxID=3042688 RepID=UPI002483038E|nr:hypothetical protein [Polyangium sp. y55x31]MDI1478792.1 hypothetical protein [Polyangium sp. y55x31]